jgi:hypothetical protein
MMLKKAALICMLIFLTAEAFGDDFVQTFNTFYQDRVQLSSQNGKWQLQVADTYTTRSAEIKILDIKNYYIRFVLDFYPSQDSDGGPIEYTFATYPRDGKKDLVAESTPSYYGFYEPVPGERQNISADVLPVGVYHKFFDEKYLDEHGDDFVEVGGMITRQSEVEGPEVFNYTLTIPQIGTKTLLSIEGDKSPDYPPAANDLIGAVRFHHIELSWDKKQGVFKIVRIY